MVRVLVVGDLAHVFRAVALQGGLARQVDDGADPAEPRLGSELQGRYHPVGPVEGAGHDLDFRAADAAKTQGRAAGGAEIAHRYRRRLVCRRLATGPGKMLVPNPGPRGERRAARLLAHPAVADADF